MLAKLVPLAIIGVLASKGLTLAKDQFAFLSDYTKISTTQSEMSAIKKLLVLEEAATGSIPQNWEDVIRSQMDAGDRDPCVDVWGTFYSVWVENDVTVGSAGPDASFDTEDDILTRN